MIQRVCQGCRKTQNREFMIKITKLESGLLKINPGSKELGRSVYVCKNIECVRVLIKKKRLRTALKCQNHKEITRVEQELLKIVEEAGSLNDI